MQSRKAKNDDEIVVCHSEPLILSTIMLAVLLAAAFVYGLMERQGRIPPLGTLLRKPVGDLIGVATPPTDAASTPALKAQTTMPQAPAKPTDEPISSLFKITGGGLLPAPKRLESSAGDETKAPSPAFTARLTGLDGKEPRSQEALPLSEASKTKYLDKTDDRLDKSEERDMTPREAKISTAETTREREAKDAQRAADLIPNGGAYVKEGFEAPELIMGMDIPDVDRLVRSGDGIVLGKLGGRDYRVNLEGPDGSILKAHKFFVVRDEVARSVSNRRLELNTYASARTAFAPLESRFVANVGEEKHGEPVFVFYPSSQVDAYIMKKQWGALCDAGFSKDRVRELAKNRTRIATRGTLVATSGRPVFLIREIIVGDESISWSDPEEKGGRAATS